MKSNGDMTHVLNRRGRGVKRVKEAENVRAPLMDFGKTSTFLLPSNASCSPLDPTYFWAHHNGIGMAQMERIIKFADKAVNRVSPKRRHFMNGCPSAAGKRQMKRNLRPNPMATSALPHRFSRASPKGAANREAGRGLDCRARSPL